MRQLTNFAITLREADFVLRLEAEGGETLEFAAPPEQMENIIAQLNDLLGEDEEDDAASAGEIYQKPLG